MLKWYRMCIRRTLTLPHYLVLRLLLLLPMQISFVTWMQMFTCLLMSIVIVFFNQWISQWSCHKWMVIVFSFCFVLLFFFSDEYFSALHCNIRSLTAHFDIFLCISLSRLWDLLKSSLKLNNNFNQYWLTRNFFTSQPFYSNAGGVAFMLTRN